MNIATNSQSVSDQALKQGQKQPLQSAAVPINALDVAALCKAAGDPLRIHILQLLEQDAFGVLELCRVLEVRQPALSHHLKILATAGLVTTRREGTYIYYRRAPREDDGLDDLRQQIFANIDKAELAPDIAERLLLEQQTRAERSVNFFHSNAQKFRDQQDLIASYTQYGELIVQSLDALTWSQSASVLEIGPGEGELLADLSSRFDQVIALDNSSAMLEKSQDFANRKGLENVRFVCGDTALAVQSLTSKDLTPADVVTLNMVLHHTPSPGEIFKDVFHLLNETGILLVTELCEHDQDWAREACGDVWLGFDPEALSQWALAAGLRCGDSQYLALRNGFRIQLRQFYK
ncbi:MAG: ArsR family transcriptional regulator [Porticoccaceae bacterium]|nr:ArsR family transcriptional regulator [Porticoccaceae bacterium]